MLKVAWATFAVASFLGLSDVYERLDCFQIIAYPSASRQLAIIYHPTG